MAARRRLALPVAAIAAILIASVAITFAIRARSQAQEAIQRDATRRDARLCGAVNQTRAAQVRAYEFFRLTVLARPGQTAQQKAFANTFFDKLEAIVGPVSCKKILSDGS